MTLRVARRPWAGALFMLAIAPVSSAHATDGLDAETDITASSGAAAAKPFALQFEPFDTDPLPVEPAPGSVDLSTFEPPREEIEILRSLGPGVASFYGRRFHGRRTANGERFNMNALTAAHKTLPFGTRVRVTNARNGRSVTVRINDRGPFIRGRTIDLSRAAAREIGMISRGHARVTLEVVAP